jgi:hypothetical protein
LRQDLGVQLLPGVGVAEEARYVDQDRVEQRGELARFELQDVLVVLVGVNADLAHPMSYLTHQARALVAGEIE